MSQKVYVQEPFNLETAKKIEAGLIDGNIVTDQGAKARILCYDFKCDQYTLGVAVEVGGGERFCCVTKEGLRSIGDDPGDSWFRELCIVRLKDDVRVLTKEEEERITSKDMKEACNFFPKSNNMQSAFLTGVAVERNKQLKDIRVTNVTKAYWVVDPVTEEKCQYKSASEYKPFERVLVYNSYHDKWFPDFFSHVATDGRIVTISGGFFDENQCQSYKTPLK